MSIANTIKNIDTDFTVLKSENAAGKVYYIPDRLAMQVKTKYFDNLLEVKNDMENN